jgi:crossover junction endodeoxyribonuclease RusA
MLPFEFVIAGPPMSARSHYPDKLADWKARVAAEAALHWRQPLFRGNVYVVVTYYHEGVVARLDADNMVKPILDAMTGVVYRDDRQASHIEVRSVNLDDGYMGRDVGKLLATKLMAGGEFLHIRVEEER